MAYSLDQVIKRFKSIIKDINNNIIGFLCVEYLDKKDFNVNIVNKEFENTDRKIEILLNSNRIEE